MEIVTAAQIQEIDRRAINEYGIPGVVLMENAGLRLVEAIGKLNVGKKVMVVAGKGNNGGDGFVVARHLGADKQVSVWTTAESKDYQGDALINLNILHKLGISPVNLQKQDALLKFKQELATADLVVDALLGTGVGREVDVFFTEIISLINESSAFVLSVDIPSGISADTGHVLGAAVQADQTVTFALPKRGLLLYPGAHYTGHLEVADIGIPQPLLQGHGFSLLTAQEAAKLLPARPANAHKGTFGSVLLVAGSLGMSGAATLATRSALRGGCGLVFAAVPHSIQPVVAAQVAEAITIPLPQSDAGCLQPEALPLLQDKWQNCSAVAIGPGMSSDEKAVPLLAAILEQCELPVVLDADALNILAKHPLLVQKRKAPTILTPHPGEAARLLASSVEEVEANRMAAVHKLSSDYNSTVILKGAHTLIAEPQGETVLNTTGNSGMATAGSGDVLTGLLAALLAQGLNHFKAAKAAVYLHGLAADLATANCAQASLVAGDIIKGISMAYLETAKIHM